MIKNYVIDVRILERFGDDVVNDASYPELIFHCPKCIERKGTHDTKGNLYVNNESLKFHCFRCGYSGNLSNAPTKGYRLNERTPQNTELMHLIENVFMSEDTEDDLIRYEYEIPNLRPFPGTDHYAYLQDRGVKDWMIEYYDIRIGSSFSKYHDRIIIPNRTDWEEDICRTDMFVARYIYPNIKDPLTGFDKYPKYMNPYGKNRNKVVFNLHRIPPHSPVILVEGVLTAIAAGKNAVCTYGKEVSDAQLYQVLEHEPSELYVNLDPDAYTEAMELCERIKKVSSVPLYVVRFRAEDGEHADASDIGHEKYMGYLMNARPYQKAELSLMDSLGMDHRYSNVFEKEKGLL